VSITGGAAGTAVAIMLVALLARVLDIPLTVHPSTVAGSLASSALSGLVAGWYPARRAVHLDVIAAMRAE
jgi:putative ABC transport system permease protein